MSLAPRRSLWSIVLLQLGLALLVLTMAVEVDARLLVVRANGTGDVPTFQAGVDALLREPSELETDTLRVEPGIYAEDVSVEATRAFSTLIDCPGGPALTEVRSLRGFSTPIEGGASLLSIHGLRVRERVDLGVQLPRPFSIPALFLDDCRFMGDVDIPKTFGFRGTGIIDCEFRGRLSLGAAGYHLVRCRFTGQTARLALWTDIFLDATECVFSGADTAVVTVSNQTDGVGFDRCRFTDVGIGIAVTLDPNGFATSSYRGVSVKDCRFENISGAAILVTPLGPPPERVRWIKVDVSGSRFENCGSAIDGRQSPPLALSMEADTLEACRESGVNASIAGATMQRVVVRGSGADGARLTLRDGIGIVIEECQFFGNHGDGLRLVDGRGGSADELSIRRNSSLVNDGAGIRLGAGAATDPTTMVMSHNLVAGNTAGGLMIQKAYAGRVENNDAWLNAGPAFEGIAGEPNVEVDPQLCDPSGEVATLAATSPCAPQGPFGQIGAMGVECDRMGVAVDALPKSNRPINPKSAAPVEVAVLGRRLFDARRVDVASVRVNGIAASTRGHGMNGIRMDDVDRDGRVDLLMAFEARTLPTRSDQLMLEGQTMDGALFKGSDGVRFTPGSTDTSHAANLESPLALVVPSPQRAADFQVRAFAAEGAAARLELFDVSGRRVLTHDLADLSADQTIHLDGAGDLHRGIYMVRMSQRGAFVTRRVVLTR